jgi:hypothetical protein
MVHVGDLVLKEPEVQQLRSLETTEEAVKRKVFVRSASNLAFAKGVDRVCTAQGFVDWGRSRHSGDNTMNVELF